MIIAFLRPRESLTTNGTLTWFFTSVTPFVYLEISFTKKSVSTHIALEHHDRLAFLIDSMMSFHVGVKLSITGELFFAQTTLKWFFASV